MQQLWLKGTLSLILVLPSILDVNLTHQEERTPKEEFPPPDWSVGIFLI